MSTLPLPDIRLNRSRRWLWLVLAIGLTGMALRVWLYRQPVNSDDILYFSTANGNWEGFSHVIHQMARIVLRLFLKIPLAVFGYSLTGFYCAVYTAAFLSCLSVFSIARALSGRHAAVIATLLWATSFVYLGADCRITPDNLGTSIALFAVAMTARAARIRPSGETPLRKPMSAHRGQLALAVVAGLMFWGAFSVRATFGAFLLVGVVVALCGVSRRRVLFGLTLGFLLGNVYELSYFEYVWGDALFRWRILLGYAEGPSKSRFYQGYTYWRMISRYPRLLLETGSSEIVFHALGWAGAVFWVVRGKARANLVKLSALLIAYGTIAFSVASFDPLVPLMREKLRYYVTAAPLFYLATADLCVALLLTLHRVRSKRNTRDEKAAGGPARRIQRCCACLAFLGIGGGLLYACGLNVVAASGNRDSVRNGNDSFLVIAAAIKQNEQKHAWSKVLFQDSRTARVIDLLLPKGREWQLAGPSGPAEIDRRGYLILNWKRLNGNVKHAMFHAPLSHRFYRIIEDHALLLRHRHAAYLTDVFLVDPEPIQRKIADITRGVAPGWNVVDSAKNYRYLGESDEVLLEGRSWVSTGRDAPWRLPGSDALPGGRFVEVVVQARADVIAPFQAYLYAWLDSQGDLPTKLYMGRAYADATRRETAFWTYLPKKANAFRVVFRGSEAGPVSIRDLKVLLLEKHERDVVRQVGGAWPDGAVQQGAGASIDDGAIVLNWSALNRRIEVGNLSADEALRLYRTIETKALLSRRRYGLNLIDTFAAEPERIERAVAEVPSRAVSIWSRYNAVDKTWGRLDDAEAMVVVTKNDWAYTGADAPWRPCDSGTVQGDRFVEILFEAEATGAGELRVGFWRWEANGKGKPVKQYTGKILAGANSRAFATWTYLPQTAAAFRIVLRGGSQIPVTVRNLRVRLLERHELDVVEQAGRAW